MIFDGVDDPFRPAGAPSVCPAAKCGHPLTWTVMAGQMPEGICGHGHRWLEHDGYVMALAS